MEYSQTSFIHDALVDAWQTYTKHFIVALANTALWLLCSVVCALTGIGILLLPGLYGGYIKSMLDLARGEEVHIGGFVRRGYGHFMPALGLQWLKFFAILFALILIIPGIYLSVAWAFALIVLMDTGRGVVDSLSYSRSLVAGYWWDLFFMTILLSFLGTFSMPVLIFILPFTHLAYIHYYLKLRASKEPVSQLAHEQVV